MPITTSPLPCTRFFFGALAVATASILPLPAQIAVVDFEPEEGFSLNERIDIVGGWQSEGDVAIISDNCFSGNQALFLQGHQIDSWVSWASGDWSAAGTTVRLAIRPSVAGDAAGNPSLHVGGVNLGFGLGDDGSIALLPLNQGAVVASIPTDARADLLGMADRWLSLTILFDDNGEQWGLVLDGQFAGGTFPVDRSAVHSVGLIIHAGTANVLLDSIAIIESKNALDDYAADRTALEEKQTDASSEYLNADAHGGYLIGKSALVFGPAKLNQRYTSQGQGSILYVNNLFGNNATANGSATAPFFSIRAAMAAASDGDTIIVQRGNGIYHEGSRSANGKRLRITMEEPVIIK